MTEQEFVFGISVFIQGKHIVTYRGTTKEKWRAMRLSYLFTADIISIASEVTAKILNPDIAERQLFIYCSRRILECAKLMRENGWDIRDPLCNYCTRW